MTVRTIAIVTAFALAAALAETRACPTSMAQACTPASLPAMTQALANAVVIAVVTAVGTADVAASVRADPIATHKRSFPRSWQLTECCRAGCSVARALAIDTYCDIIVTRCIECVCIATETLPVIIADRIVSSRLHRYAKACRKLHRLLSGSVRQAHAK